MKIHPVAGILFVCMLSCTYEGIERINDGTTEPPVREVHYNLETGAIIAEKNYTYDDRGNLTGEYFKSVIDPASNKDVTYEYNAGNWLVKKKEKYAKIANGFFITEFEYKNGLKQSETAYWDSDQVRYNTQYFYTTNVPDSAQYFTYSTTDSKLYYGDTWLYQYDEQKRLIKSALRNGRAYTIYAYNSDKLTSTCNYYDIYGIMRERCIVNQYDGLGQVTRTFKNATDEYPAVTNQLQEEFFYKGNLVDEKRVYEYFPYYKDTLVITQIKYEY